MKLTVTTLTVAEAVDLAVPHIQLNRFLHNDTNEFQIYGNTANTDSYRDIFKLTHRISASRMGNDCGPKYCIFNIFLKHLMEANVPLQFIRHLDIGVPRDCSASWIPVQPSSKRYCPMLSQVIVRQPYCDTSSNIDRIF